MKRSVLLIYLSSILIGHGLAASEGNPSPSTEPQFKFVAYDGNPQNADTKEMTFQINDVDKGRPASFLRIGEFIPKSKFKLLKFQYKTRNHPQYGEEDASELTLLNTATNETLVLVKTPIIHAVGKPK